MLKTRQGIQSFFVRTFLYEEHEAKKCTTFQTELRRRTQRGKGKARGFILDTVQDNGKQFVSRLMLISTKSPLVLCM